METRIQKDLVAAMKDTPLAKIVAIREIKTAIMKFKTAPDYKGECTDNDIVSIIQKLVKQHEESAVIYLNAGRTELANEETEQMKYMGDYLPQMISNDQLERVIDEVIRDLGLSTMKDMGRVMGHLKTTFPNQYDAKYASNYIKSKLS
jgi:uncharacterized protein YqeY